MHGLRRAEAAEGGEDDGQKGALLGDAPGEVLVVLLLSASSSYPSFPPNERSVLALGNRAARASSGDLFGCSMGCVSSKKNEPMPGSVSFAPKTPAAPVIEPNAPAGPVCRHTASSLSAASSPRLR